ncbi:SPV073 putative late transcription factor VLTF-4 [Swinepox virus]|uniref:SPV073 putative late transcription factor VLTF-4 n=1 Tax=Swinepox virus (strain Swine/Nebraska/17077-99/1999) TaxID=300880 RepID=Q8V3M2_SWPV1|nr:SPV073 putative late transcription factor VLTF-4 [Swinepox virus]AAL69812.1 SPV073 putative late transcription factor VLTF-4 [Swinepox virus]UED36630.1 SPV073 putative late transcription factor VLTF-4 [Swinepox virus]UED36779.1 SPV073 putative late transcription factor VLTF-4 [Swinepox virus]UUA44263.1 SPV073 [Swinepox virus]
MSWSINLGNTSDNFKTLDEIRQHVRSTTETDKCDDDLFPNDLEIPVKRQPRKKTPTKKHISKSKCVERDQGIEENEDGEKTEENEDDVDSVSPQPSTSARCCNQEDSMDNSELKIVTANIISALKTINSKVNAVSIVLEDIQASSISRQYTTLIKLVNDLKSLAECGKKQVTRKKTRVTKK